MVRQVQALAGDLEILPSAFGEQLSALLPPAPARLLRRVYLVGCGDSHFASHAAELAFQTLAGVQCQSLSALQFSEYCAPGLGLALEPCWVVGISASGGTPAVVKAIEQARSRGVFSIAVTANAPSALSQVADVTLVVSVPSNERSPGIRSYQASLLGLFLLAIRLGELREQHSAGPALALRGELRALSELVAATAAAWKSPCQELARELQGDPRVIVLGTGPSHGTALFSAAKLVEAAGISALGQDVEEWWHVERFAYPLDMLLFVIAPSGRAHWRAAEIASAALQRGRRVVSVSPAGARSLAAHAWRALTVEREVREEFSPLVYHVFAGYLAAYTATELGRGLFQSPAAQSPVA
jgi:glucosamine--fructose-6-phosphate aminotransferase (isomerizing)